MTWNPIILPDLSGRTYAVTGASAGIGYFASEQLTAAGAHVVLASRSVAKLAAARKSILARVPEASLTAVAMDLASLSSVDAAAAEIAALPRLDGIFLNGGPMTMSRKALTADGLPELVGTHVVANVRLLAGILPLLSGSGSTAGNSRVVHASTGFVRLKRYRVEDLRRLPLTGIGAYTKAKTATEVFGLELDRRLRAAGLPVASILTRPGVGVDAKTPLRPGVRDASTQYRRNPYTPWAQGKDSAAWPGVRALTDPGAQGGEYYGPLGRLRGEPVRVPAPAHTAEPGEAAAQRFWDHLEDLAGVRVFGPTAVQR